MPGVYHTEDPLGFASFYDGQDPNGAWSLWIVDDQIGDDGVLLSWSMTFENNSPEPMLAYADTTICLTQVLNVDVSQYDSYLWSTGHNSQSIQLFGDILGLGTTEVFVTVDQDGCTGVSNSFTLTVDACAGIEEIGGLTIDVYPNPSTGMIILDMNGDSNGLTVEVTDMHGKVIYSQKTGAISTGLRSSIDLTSMANGMYFLKLEDGSSSVTRKLIKQ
jgi:hypothetical protein